MRRSHRAVHKVAVNYIRSSSWSFAISTQTSGGDMSAPNPTPQRYPRLQRLIEWLTYGYLIRFPLLTATALVGIPYAAVRTGARSLLENLFDLDPGAIMLVTMTALLTAWSVMATTRLALIYSNERFGVSPPKIGFLLGWRHILFFGL